MEHNPNNKDYTVSKELREMVAQVKTDADGNLVLDDPAGLAVATAVAKHNCGITYQNQLDRVNYFSHRMIERCDDYSQVMVVLINVDEPSGLGKELADMLMPEMDWQQYRDRGETPFARGLAGREGVQNWLDLRDKDAGDKLREIHGFTLAVVDHGVADVWILGE